MRSLGLFALLLPCITVGCGDFGLAELDAGPSAGALVAVTPSGEVRFSTASPFGSPTEETLVVRAAGDEAVTVSDVSLSGDDRANFDIGAVRLPSRLQPDEELEVPLSFSPDAVGGFVTTLVIETSSDVTPELERRLIGQGCNDGNRDGRCDPSGPDPVDSDAPEG